VYSQHTYEKSATEAEIGEMARRQDGKTVRWQDGKLSADYCSGLNGLDEYSLSRRSPLLRSLNCLVRFDTHSDPVTNFYFISL